MKELWIEIDESFPVKVKNSLMKSAPKFCDVLLVDSRDVEKARKSGVKTAASSGDSDINVLEVFDEGKAKKLKETGKTVAVKVSIHGREDEKTIARAVELSYDYIILDCPDWKIIPLENVIAMTRGKTKLLAEVPSAKDAKVALETLELGADGVVLKTYSLEELAKTAAITNKKTLKIELMSAKVVELKQIGMGARVCVDTCDLMKLGEGILAGCQSSGLFLVQAEVHKSPYVETRPFRVNVGPVSLYALSSLSKTRYLSELKAGDEVLVVDRKGKTRSTHVGRVKIEWRPMLLIEAECKGRRIKTIVQNAETIRLVTRDGSKSVTGLKTGDEVLVYITKEGGRHFGTLVKEEMVIER
ncbi:MAG: 3-dehydroquinate synthase II [Candidatus Bathyarchaeota archaeon]|nr:MAG: 3-dehydroquinate synthase II [Candidatus Bathyarchaeota archaeon]